MQLILKMDDLEIGAMLQTIGEFIILAMMIISWKVAVDD